MIDTSDLNYVINNEINERFDAGTYCGTALEYDEILTEYLIGKLSLTEKSDVISMAYILNSKVTGREDEVFSNLIFSLINVIGCLQSYTFSWEIESVLEPTVKFNPNNKIEAIVTDFQTEPLQIFCHAYTVFKNNFIKEDSKVIQKYFEN